MASAANASAYELFELEKNGKAIDISGTDPYGARVVNFDYYESLLSPNVSGYLTIADIGGSVPYDRQYSRQEKYGTLSSALPLTGDIRVKFRITNPSIDPFTNKRTELDFSRKPLIFDKVTVPDQGSHREGVGLSLFSQYCKQTQLSVTRNYNGNIGNSVRKLLKDYVGVPDNNIFITPSQNSLSFYGWNKSVYEVICGELAPQTIPIKGNPGYFFYETQDGFNFRAIDELVSQAPVASYFKNERLRSSVKDNTNDFKINFMSVLKRGDNMTGQRAGVFSNEMFTFDPIKHEYKENKNTINLPATLGKIYEVPTTPSSITYFTIPEFGTFNSGVENILNNDPKNWLAQSSTRYNSLFDQIIQIQVPCNLNLRAGNVINCNFEVISQENKSVGSTDETQSGRYLILSLCHHFDSTSSCTSMMLVRDSYG